MSKKLIVNSLLTETRVALIEDDRLKSIRIELANKKDTVGNIYLGTVSRVLPGIQSAFVEIGTSRSTFLYCKDAVSDHQRNEFYQARIDEDQGSKSSGTHPKIESLLHEGQKVAVQISKEPLGTKGARVTMQLSIAGRHVVLLPEIKHVAISKRITDAAEIVRLKEIGERIYSAADSRHGLIFRTAAENVSEDSIQKDYQKLLDRWQTIKQKMTTKSAPCLLHRDQDLIVKSIRDQYTDDIEEIIVDSQSAFDSINYFLEKNIPTAISKLKRHNKANLIFDEYDIEVELAKALNRKVWLPSGGSLVFDQTEALMAIDVNTGRYVGKQHARDTILKTNLEAAKEVAHQLELRSIGGIVIVDFIDMEEPEDREQIYQVFCSHIETSKAKTNILPISELGILQMTRKRTSESLPQQMTSECTSCQGTGRNNSLEAQGHELLREIKRNGVNYKGKPLKHGNLPQLEIDISFELNEWIKKNQTNTISEFKDKYMVDIEFKVRDKLISGEMAQGYEIFMS